MAKEFVKQHIVPKRYLDRFAFATNNGSVVGTRMIKNGKLSFFATNTDNVGYIKGYYDVTDKDDPKHWEHFFAQQIDTLCGVPLENLISKIILSRKDSTIIEKQEKVFLSKLVMAQMLRIPGCMSFVDEICAKNIDGIKRELFEALPQNLLDKYKEQIQNFEVSEQWKKEQFLNNVFSSGKFDKYCKLMKKRIWVVYVNAIAKEMPFVTSDNPVLVEGIGHDEIGLFKNGIANPTTCIFFPISPSIAIASYSHDSLVEIIADKIDGKMLVLDDIKFIGNKNTKLIDQAFQYSFIPQPLYDELTEH